MSFLETVEKARAFLERNGRVSLSALRLEFGLDEVQIEALVDELVDVQLVAAREGKVLAWLGTRAAERNVAAAEATPSTDTAARETLTAATAAGERRQLT